MDEVEAALIDQLQREILTTPMLDLVLGEVRKELDAQLARHAVDIVALEDELRTARADCNRFGDDPSARFQRRHRRGAD
jgi:hypothetical protein